MKKIIYTQRVEIVESYGERRDCADVEIAKLIWECGFLPVSVNNIPDKIQVFLEQIKPDGMILTGGNDLSKYGGNALERDETEKRMIEYSVKNDVPLYGFCRGMQMIIIWTQMHWSVCFVPAKNGKCLYVGPRFI